MPRVLRLLLPVAVAASILGAGIASGQDGGGGTNVGGTVPSVLMVSVDQPDGFASFPARAGRREATLAIAVAVTASDSPVQLSVADGDATSGARRGRLIGGGAPLQVSASGASGGAQSLDAPVDPLLRRWDVPLANAPVSVTLHQPVGAAAHRGPYRKLVLMTVSSDTP